MRTAGWIGLCAAVLLAAIACREGDGPLGPVQGGARMFVSSAPQGARILVDERETGLLTPDTIAGLFGTHALSVRLDSMGAQYQYVAQFTVTTPDTLLYAHAPLVVVCPPQDTTECNGRLHRYHTAAGARFASSPLGSLFLRQGEGQGLFWPGGTDNSYVSGGIPLFAGRLPAGVVALGPYDYAFLGGRPAPATASADGVFTLSQQTWLLPPTSGLRRSLTVRGVSVSEQVVAVDSVQGAVLIRLLFRNITADPDYRIFDPYVGDGLTFTDAYIGLMVDPDIGAADDDWFSYDAELDMVFAYDARFSEPSFTAGAAAAPALVGLRALRAPAGATVMLNGWLRAGDWRAGELSEVRGYEMLSGEVPYAPTHGDPRIGHLPPAQGDVRVSVAAGPLTLVPGDSAEIVLALVLASPAVGTFQSGSVVPPGEPLDSGRALYRVAAGLRARALLAESLLEHAPGGQRAAR